jgi:hypothetical protein
MRRTARPRTGRGEQLLAVRNSRHALRDRVHALTRGHVSWSRSHVIRAVRRDDRAVHAHFQRIQTVLVRLQRLAHYRILYLHNPSALTAIEKYPNAINFYRIGRCQARICVPNVHSPVPATQRRIISIGGGRNQIYMVVVPFQRHYGPPSYWHVPYAHRAVPTGRYNMRPVRGRPGVSADVLNPAGLVLKTSRFSGV